MNDEEFLQDDFELAPRLSATEALIAEAIYLLPPETIDFAVFTVNNELPYYLTQSGLTYKEARWLLDQIYYSVQGTQPNRKRIRGLDADIIWQYVITPSYDQLEKFRTGELANAIELLPTPNVAAITNTMLLPEVNRQLELLPTVIKQVYHSKLARRHLSEIQYVIKAIILNEEYAVSEEVAVIIRRGLLGYRRYIINADKYNVRWYDYQLELNSLLLLLYERFANR